MEEFYPDFTKGEIWRRVQKLDLKHEMLYKAIGIKSGHLPTVIDATAGWGRDSMIIAAFGCTVVMLEKNSSVADKLQYALNQAIKNDLLRPIVNRMSLHNKCAIQFFIDNTVVADVIYCDPMFTNKRSALPKKELQVLQDLVGSQDNPKTLVEKAILSAKNRVVVKRSKATPPYVDNPSFTLKARSHHFDIYLTNKE
jgi:16S rRNA (guanine1516-N2)-methyltransferase